MDRDLRNRVPLERRELEAFFRRIESSPYDERDEFFELSFSASRVLSNFVWDIYSYNAYLHYIRSKAPQEKPPISQTGIHVGDLPPDQTQLLKEIFESCQEGGLDPFNFRQGYLHEPAKSGHESMSRINRYYTPSAKFHFDFPKILDSLASEIERICGHFWRVCALRVFNVRPLNQTQGYHVDGWPYAIKKLYFLPNGAGAEQGSTLVQDKLGRTLLPSGGPGTWMLFENSLVMHQALPDATMERPTIEITVAPAFRTDTTLTVSGSNGMFPFFPYDAPLLDENALPDEFRISEVEHRARRRTAGLAAALPAGDYSLGLDPFIPLK